MMSFEFDRGQYVPAEGEVVRVTLPDGMSRLSVVQSVRESGDTVEIVLIPVLEGGEP